jgi:hypothetical protein
VPTWSRGDAGLAWRSGSTESRGVSSGSSTGNDQPEGAAVRRGRGRPRLRPGGRKWLQATPALCFGEDGSRGGWLQLAPGVALMGTEDRVLGGGGGSALVASLEPGDDSSPTPPARWRLAWQDAEQSWALIASGSGRGT